MGKKEFLILRLVAFIKTLDQKEKTNGDYSSGRDGINRV